MMDSANLPSQTDLNSLYGAWNPMAYIQGQQNQDLAAQFRDQAYKANQNTVTEGALKNDQASQMNPLLVTQQGLTNTGLALGNQTKSIANASSGIDLGQKQSLAPQDLEVKRLNLQNQLGDQQYNNLSNTISMGYLKALHEGDADTVAKLKPMLEFLNGPTGGTIADRAQKRDLTELQRITQQNVANIQAGSAANVAGINAGAKVDVAGIHATSSVQIAGIKQTLNQKLAQLNTMDQSNPQVAALTAQTRRDLATANAAYANAIDLEKLQGGGLGRQDVPGTVKPQAGTAENPIVLK